MGSLQFVHWIYLKEWMQELWTVSIKLQRKESTEKRTGGQKGVYYSKYGPVVPAILDNSNIQGKWPYFAGRWSAQEQILCFSLQKQQIYM